MFLRNLLLPPSAQQFIIPPGTMIVTCTATRTKNLIQYVIESNCDRRQYKNGLLFTGCMDWVDVSVIKFSRYNVGTSQLATYGCLVKLLHENDASDLAMVYPLPQ